MLEVTPFILHDLGSVPYGEAFALQKELQQEVIGWRAEADAASRPAGYLLLLEHDPPVVTVSRRKAARQHLVATDQMLRGAGVEVAETDRGGDITYHGPGQLVVYPILDLNRLGLRLHGYMRLLEEVVIDTLAAFGIVGGRDLEATGVWINAETPKRRNAETGSAGVPPAASPLAPGSAGGSYPNAGDGHAHGRPCDSGGDPPPEVGAKGAMPNSKICAMGVRISRWVSMHGLALNVNTNLDHFDLIVPCGLAGRGVTSMERLLGDACPPMREVKEGLVRSMTARLEELRNRTESRRSTVTG